MRYLAILKDSVREALDSKVLYVMIGLSLLVVLLVGLIGYQPVSLEVELNRYTGLLSWVIERQTRNAQKTGAAAVDATAATFSIADFQQTNAPAPPWEGDYRFALIMTFNDAKAAEEAGKGKSFLAMGMERGLRQQFHYIKNIDIKQGTSSDPKQLRFDVTTHGTEAKSRAEWPHEPVFAWVLPMSIFHFPLYGFVQFFEDWLVNWAGAGVALLLSIVVTAFFIPNMLRKGTIDLLLAKPINRPTLLVYKYPGGLTFMFVNTLVIVGGIWLVLGLRTGLWGTGFLFSIFVLTYEFAIFYAVSTLFGVMTRNSLVAILTACAAWVLFVGVVGYGYKIIDGVRHINDVFAADETRTEDEKPPDLGWPAWVFTTADVIHFVTPHIKDLDTLTTKWIVDDLHDPSSKERQLTDKVYENFRWTEALTVSTLYIIVFLGLSCWWFATRDY